MAEYIKREELREILDGWRDAHADVDDVHGCGLLWRENGQRERR